MQQFWDQRYAENDMVYGLQPNYFLKLFLDLHKPGSILLPAEGEGRNAVYAAKNGWDVTAFDYSKVARAKALEWAAREHVTIHYQLSDVGDYSAASQFDAIGLIYVHLPVELRIKFHHSIIQSLKPGGFLVLEAFAKDQLKFESGGPRDPAMLYDAATLCNDFGSLHILSCEQKEITLKEGEFHQGKAAVLRMIAQKL